MTPKEQKLFEIANCEHRSWTILSNQMICNGKITHPKNCFNCNA